jgi:urease accessory protein
MLVLEQLPGQVAAEELRGKKADKLLLSWEQRRWARGRFVTAQGREIALALPTGTRLEPGRTLCVEADWYLAVEAVSEPVLAIGPRDRQEAIQIAFEIGNRHFPLAVESDNLLVPDDPAMVQLLERAGVPWERRLAVFTPISKLSLSTSDSERRSGRHDP